MVTRRGAMIVAASALLGCGRVGFAPVDGDRAPDGAIDAPAAACVRSISTGDDHTCAIRTDGELFCWGGNSAGQLGIGTQSAAMSPVTIITGATQRVFLGPRHGCAVVGNELRCWGRNLDGELGDGTTVERTTPVAVELPPGGTFDDGAAGLGFTCALGHGAVWCWGRNNQGQLGDGTRMSHSTPAPVAGANLPGFKALALGNEHACALDTNNAVWCWGANADGQLGDGGFADRLVPTRIAGLSATAIAAGGDFTCAVGTDGRAYCWGADDNGQLGDGEPRAASATPVMVTGNAVVVDIGVGSVHACAVLASGGVECWGRHNGRLGDGDPPPSPEYVPVPVAVLNQTEAVEVALGIDSTCVRRGSGRVDCWGQNDRGELGRGSLVNATAPNTSEVTGAAQLAMSGYRACAIDAAGSLECWGSNADGELGTGGPTDEETPMRVASGVTSVSAGTGFTCATFDPGDVQCWGRSSSGRLGIAQADGIPRLAPIAITPTPGLVDARMVAAGTSHTCAVTATGLVFCWGSNFAGELGDGTTDVGSTPVSPLLPSGAVVTDIAGGDAHTCARIEAGFVYCWGAGGGGRLGTGSGASSTMPVMTASAGSTRPGWTAIAAGSDASCATDATGALSCWGSNGDGDLGDGTTMNRTTPTATLAGAPVVSFDAGNQLGCAVVGGVLSCWGEGAEGKLGDGTFVDRATPGPVAGLPPIAAVSAGLGDHACALDATGRVWCWGAGLEGQLGGERVGSSLPRAVDVPCP